MMGSASGLLLTAVLALPAAAATPAPAAAVKAVFLVNFAKLVEWPPSAFRGPGAPLVIGILGADQFGPVLDEAAAGENVRGRAIEVKRFRRLADLEKCHLLFISAAQEYHLAEIFRHLRRDSTLTVADMDGFVARGGAIQFRNVRGRLRFEIRRDAAERAGLRVNARLLSLGGAVPPGGP